MCDAQALLLPLLPSTCSPSHRLQSRHTAYGAAQCCESMMHLARAALCSSSSVRQEGLWRAGRRQWGDGREGGLEQGRADTHTATPCSVSACAEWLHAAVHRLESRPAGGGEGADRAARRRGGENDGEQHKVARTHARTYTHAHTHAQGEQHKRHIRSFTSECTHGDQQGEGRAE
jgi:hypothetical protein